MGRSFHYGRLCWEWGWVGLAVEVACGCSWPSGPQMVGAGFLAALMPSTIPVRVSPRIACVAGTCARSRMGHGGGWQESYSGLRWVLRGVLAVCCLFVLALASTNRGVR